MTADQPSPNVPEQPDVHGAVPADGQPGPADRQPLPNDTPPDSRDRGSDPRDAAPASREVTVRRAPKLVPFMAVGVIIGFIAAFIVAYTGPEDPTLTRESILGFFTVAFAIPGLIIAALLVLIFDRRSVKRAERARAERTYDDDAA